MDPWERVKPIIETLYMLEKRRLAQVVSLMKSEHHFDRLDHQYRYQFRKWNWSRKAGKENMPQILKHVKRRFEVGKSSTVMLNGREVDGKKIRRALKEEKRALTDSLVLNSVRNQNAIVDGPVLPFTNNFNMEVVTPSSAASPHGAPSPMTQVIRESMMIDRARMFAQGQHEKLLTVLNEEERRHLSDWLYQYWLFCFKTAKHWGKGPTIWTAQHLDFNHLPGTPQDSTAGPMPSNLCQWYIHVEEKYYEAIAEDQPTSASFSDYNLDDDSTWEPWPQSREQPPLQTRLRDGLEHNDFSPTPAANLPVAIPQIARAAKRSDNELLLESLGFSIMSRNVDQVIDVTKQIDKKGIEFKSLYPFHLTTSFLDGAKSCCSIMSNLARLIRGAEVYPLYTNEHGHTILDNLMIAIIKSHTSATPVTVDQELRDTPRFIGEEVDICGRWDADSPCVRHLYASGNPSIPSSWKHKFCNTSIQTICDCILQAFARMPNRLLLDTPSGLYIRRCFDPNCGKKLQLQPLHSLVMTAYHLATQGRDDEDLFGILSCALCMISCGFDPCVTAEISVAALLDIDALIECDHEELTAAGLAERIQSVPAVSSWSAKLRSGWAVLYGVLYRCEKTLVEQGRSGSDEDDESNDGDVFIGSSKPSADLLEVHNYNDPYSHLVRKDLSTLWASTQAELLSYRRLDTNLAWMSKYFSMEMIQEQLRQGETLETGYSKNGLLRTHCTCHSFGGYPLVPLSDAVDPNIANLDVWGRASYGPLFNH
ncbi:hypothetical protein GQ44DRAFT_753373 [Phaeosphaeriaceae sp. PMI808]|nr:hypothetical protein GQ44DRAFT_753373 [Phaeosphaeriaceae sp. PMI808]